jgi:hypothetical protein
MKKLLMVTAALAALITVACTPQSQAQQPVAELPRPQHNGVRGDQAGRDQKPAFETMPPYYGVCEIDFNRRVELYVYPAQGIVRRVEQIH